MKNSIVLIAILITTLSCVTEEKIEDVVVIGGGLMGSSTAWELSKNGQNVLLIEQQDSIYTYGSSFGEARISRSLGPKDDIFSYLQQTSVSETSNLIDYLNEGKKETLHSMEDIYTTSPVTYIFSKFQLSDAEALLNGPKDNYKYASNKAEAEQLFGMNIPDTSLVIREFKEYSGTLNPKVLIKKLHLGIRKSGNRVNYNQKVTDLRKENGIYKITVVDVKSGENQTILSKKVVAAAGPYNGTLVKDVAPYFSSLISPKRLFLSFLKIKSDTYDLMTNEQRDRLNSSYPVAYLNSEIFYSMIEKYDENNRPLLKVGGHFLRTEIEDLDAVWEKELSAEEILWSKKNTADYLNKLNITVALSDLEYARGYSCVYSLTESETPIVSHAIVKNKEVDSSFVLIGGMSGIGAKGALAYGLIAADLVSGNENKSLIYQKAKSALGSKRLIENIQKINK